jgi:hypothetical protein
VGLDFDGLAGRRVWKPDAVSVQEETLARRLNFCLGGLGGRAVETVASHGMADAGEVHAYLVGTAGADADF